MTKSSTDLSKAVHLPEGQDANHTYVYRSGEYGDYFIYWYKDRAGNYVKYSNAPEGDPDHDPVLGEPIMDQSQPFLMSAPQFFTSEGWKRSNAPPQGVELVKNPDYSKLDERKVWFEMYQQNGKDRYIYLDADIKENVDLYAQYHLRVTDSNLTAYRKYAASLFVAPHIKDKMTGCLLILVDQAMFTLDELVNAVVADIQFIDRTVKLLEKKFVPDEDLFDFLTSIVANRDPSDPLFEWQTLYGKQPVGYSYMSAVCASIRVSPKFLHYWHASHYFSRIVNKLAAFGTPKEDLEELAFQELALVLNTEENVRCCVDYRLRETLVANYEDTQAMKSFNRDTTDNYGVFDVDSSLDARVGDELEFSTWLHDTPLHEVNPEEVPETPEESGQPVGEEEGVLEPEEPTDEAVNEPDEAPEETV